MCVVVVDAAKRCCDSLTAPNVAVKGNKKCGRMIVPKKWFFLAKLKVGKSRVDTAVG
jgi:hypothetical protein